MQQFHGLPINDRALRAREQVLDGREHERERRPELVAHIAEEGRLGAIKLGERLGALALLLVRRCVAHGLRQASGEQIVEPAVRDARPPQERADTEDDEAERPPSARALEGQDDRRPRSGNLKVEVDEPRAALSVGRSCGAEHLERPRRFVAEGDGWRRSAGAFLDVRRAGEPSYARALVEQIDKGKGYVMVEARDLPRRVCASVLFRPGVRRVRERAEQAQAPLLDDLLGRLEDGAEHTADSARLVADRTVREREVPFLGSLAAHER